MFIPTEILTKFYKGMFTGQPVEFKGTTFSLKKVSGLRAYKVGKLLFIEQNTRKKSKWAEMARRGTRIMWVIDTKQDRYVFQVLEGKILRL